MNMATIQPSARLQAILDRLHGIRRNGTGFTANCPAHPDKNPSLSITERDGKIFIHCHAGCTPEAICAALGLTLRDLFDDNNTGGNNNGPAPRPVAYYDYRDEKGEVLYQTVRYEPGFDGKKKTFKQRRPDGNGGWFWNLDGVCRILYRLPEVLRAEQIIICEGEKDSDTVASLALPLTVGTTNVGGCKAKWLPGYTHSLRGKHIIIIPDNDGPGRKHAEEVGASVHAVTASLKIVTVPRGKDLTEFIEQGGTKEELLDLIIRKAPLWSRGSRRSSRKANLSPNVQNFLRFRKSLGEEFSALTEPQWRRPRRHLTPSTLPRYGRGAVRPLVGESASIRGCGYIRIPT